MYEYLSLLEDEVIVIKIKVLQVIGNLRIGGAETVAMNIYRYIDREKFEFHYLVYGTTIGEYEEEVKELGGKVIHMNYLPKDLSKYKKQLKQIVNRYGPYDIIHTHMMFHNGIVLKSAKELGIPIRISHAHSTNNGGDVKGIIKLIIRYVYIYLSRIWIRNNAIEYIACGKMAGDYLYGKRFFEKNGILIKNGVNLDKYKYNNIIRQLMRNQYNLNGKKVYACIGHFERVKNQEFVIRVFERISKNNINARLVLLGEGKLKKHIQNLVKELNLVNKVLFTGNVNNVNEWMQAIDFLLMPSLYEGVPVTLIEAQAAGLKCFVSNRISKEVDITKTIKFIPLENSIEEWVGIDKEDKDYIRDVDLKQLVKSGYDIKANIQIIEEEYYRLLERIYE